MGLINVSIRYLADVNWVDAAECRYNIAESIDVWRINISRNTPLLDSFSKLMTGTEHARAARYFHVKDHNRFIVSRGALRIIIGSYLNIEPSAVEFGIGGNKKPYIKTPANQVLHYNISHSGDYILLAVSGSPVGVDVEPLNNDFNFKEIIGEYFSPEEIKYITEEQSTARFFMLWTRKEALTKATGKGLDNDLKFVPCLDGSHLASKEKIGSETDWYVQNFKLNANYFGSVACNIGIQKTRFWDIDLKRIVNI